MVPSRPKQLSPDNICNIRVVHLNRITKAREDAIPDKEAQRLSLIFKVLGDPTRIKLLMALMEGDMCVCDLSAFLGLSESAVSHHLKRLKDLYLVKSRRQGQILYYSLDDEHVSRLLKMGLEHIRE